MLYTLVCYKPHFIVVINVIYIGVLPHWCVTHEYLLINVIYMPSLILLTIYMWGKLALIGAFLLL